MRKRVRPAAMRAAALAALLTAVSSAADAWVSADDAWIVAPRSGSVLRDRSVRVELALLPGVSNVARSSCLSSNPVDVDAPGFRDCFDVTASRRRRNLGETKPVGGPIFAALSCWRRPRSNALDASPNAREPVEAVVGTGRRRPLEAAGGRRVVGPLAAGLAQDRPRALRRFCWRRREDGLDDVLRRGVCRVGRARAGAGDEVSRGPRVGLGRRHRLGRRGHAHRARAREDAGAPGAARPRASFRRVRRAGR